MKYFFLFFLFCANAWGQEVPSSWDFVTIKTAHFDIIVNARQQELGKLYAEKLELAYDFLVPLFTRVPDRTILVINDSTDITNGWATKVPYSHMMAYPVLPGPTDSLSESGDWALELLAHEFTHILTFEPAEGIFKPLRYIFGSIVSPNLLLPRWWSEGVAVHIESKISLGGRLSSIYQDSIIRSLSQSKKIWNFNLAEANEALPSWPEGHRPYLFGSLMWNSMVAEQGDNIIDTLHQRHGRRVPYFIETPAREHLGKSYVEQFHVALAEADQRAQKQIATLKQKELSQLDWLNLETKYLTQPSISPDGKYMAVISVDETNRREIKILERQASQTFNESDKSKKIESFKENQIVPTPQDSPPTGSIQRISWFTKSRKLVFDKIDNINRIERYSDLHIYDFDTQKSEQITFGLRGREPSVSPTDTEIVFVKLGGGKTHLAIYNLLTKAEKILWSPAPQERISYPLFLSDDQIIFSLRGTSADDKLLLFDRKSSSLKTILAEYKNARFPSLTKDGLLFTSSNNGVHNLYWSDLNFKKVKSVSHLLTSGFSSAWDPVRNDLYLSVLTDRGSQIARLPAEDWNRSRDPLPKIDRLYADRYPTTATATNKASKDHVIESTEEYSSLTKLWPHYWLPSLYTSSVDNNIVLQASTSGHDPLKRHQYSLAGVYETGLKRGSLLGAYQNNQTPWPLLLQSSELNTYLYSVDNLLTHTSTSFSVWPDIFAFNRYSLLEVGVRQSQVKFQDTSVTREGSLLRYVYSNFTKSGVQISPESGQSFYLGGTDYFKSNDDNPHAAYIFGGSIYHSRWLPKRNVIMLKLNGFHIDKPVAPIFGATNHVFMPFQDFPTPLYVTRGYFTGQFVGRKLYNVNFEYRFPISNIYWGRGTDPYFIRRLHGAFVSDGIAVHGIAYNRENDRFENVKAERQFWSYGLEARLETSLGYVLPLNIIAGLYTVSDDQFAPKVSGGINLQAGSSF